MDQRSGRPAQDEFKLLCSQAGLTCNPSLEDDHGWDFIVEIPAPSTHDLPADKVPAPKRVLVQVKSTGGRVATTRMKVSNALEFAKTGLPCFVILFHQRNDGGEHIYACHFWKELIERALRRGRQVSAEHKLPHKATMNISFSDQDKHSDDDLIAWMRALVDALPQEYGTEKRDLCETLGYDAQNYRVNVTFGPSEGVEDLVDHQLGLKDYLSVSHIKATDSRFGIDAPNPIFESASGEIRFKLQPAARECNVVLQASSGDIISLPATMRVPAIPGLPPEKFKLRIETWLFTVVLSSEEITLKVDNPRDRKLPLERLVELASFFSWGGAPISVKIVADSFSPPNFPVDFPSTGNEGVFRNLANLARTLRRIQSHAGVATVDLALHDLQTSWRELSALHEILTAKDMPLRIVPGPTWKPESCFSRVLGYFDLEVGGVTFLVVFDAPITEQSVYEDHILLNCGERVWCDCFVSEEADGVQKSGQASYEMQAVSHGQECLPIGNFRALLRN